MDFTEECGKAIEEIKKIKEEIPLHHHADVNKAKEIFLVAGNEAFAISISQMGLDGKREIIQFWSKHWCNETTTYTKAERLALATREVIRHFRAILIGSVEVRIYVSDKVFIELARDPISWTSRMHKYLAHTIQLSAPVPDLPCEISRRS